LRLASPPEPRRIGQQVPARNGFYLRLTRLRPGGNQALSSVCPMTPQLTPASGRENNGVPWSRTGGDSAHAESLCGDLGVLPGESDSARMVSGVLLLVIATITMALALAWWLI
jgi:hypothetical protein